MKIAIIGHKRIPSNEGGIEKGVEEHAWRMVERGHDVVALNRGGHNVFGTEFDKERLKCYRGIKIVTIPTIRGSLEVPLYSFLATLYCIFTRPDVVSYRASGPCCMIPLAKLFGLRVIASLHGIDSQREKWGRFASWYLRQGEKFAARYADACLVLSKNMKEYMDSKYGVNSVLFANGIDEPIHQEAELITRKWQLGKNDYILSIGRIVPEKCIHLLIHSFKKIDTDKKLVIAGGAYSNESYYRSLREIAKEDNRIIFTGFVEGKVTQELYSNALIFAMPSNLEGMANALLEAMSYGNCCLVSDIPENTEVVKNYAITHKKGDAHDLQNKIKYLLENPNVIECYKQKAAPYILSMYNWDTVVDQILEIYNGHIVNYSDLIASK